MGTALRDFAVFVLIMLIFAALRLFGIRLRDLIGD